MANYEKHREGSPILDLKREEYALVDRLRRGRGGIPIASKVTHLLVEGLPLSSDYLDEFELTLVKIAEQDVKIAEQKRSAQD